MSEVRFDTIDEYIKLFNEDVQEKLIELRKVIIENAPNAIEKISYKMPTLHLYRNLVHFAAFDKHIGFYPGAKTMEIFDSELSDYKKGKGSVQFPLNKPISYDLVARMVKCAVEINTREYKK